MASGLAGSGDPVDRRGKRAPGGPLLVEDPAAGWCQRVEPAPALTGALDPAAQYPTAFLEAVKQWIEGGGAERHGAVRALLYQLAAMFFWVFAAIILFKPKAVWSVVGRRLLW